jgi:hypothetical protein
MSLYLTPLLQFQRFFLPGFFGLLAWSIWRTVWKKDLAVGLALYLGLVIIVDGFLNVGIYLPGFEKGSIRFSELCAVFLIFSHPEMGSVPPIHRKLCRLVGLYFVLLFLSALRSDSIQAGIFEFRRLIIPQIIAFMIAKRGLGHNSEYRRFFLCIIAIVLIIGLFTFWDVFFDRCILKSDMLFKPEYWMNRKNGRFGSIFLNPNYLGAFVVLVFPAAFIWTFIEREGIARVYAWIGLLSMVFSLVETKSRGPILAFGIGIIMLILGPCGLVTRKRRFGFLVLFTMVFTLLTPGFYEHASERFSSLEEETGTQQLSRQAVWIYTKRIIGDHPFGGIGFGEQQFIKAMTDIGVVERYGGSLDNPHNSYLQIALYAGLPALGTFLLANGLLLLSAVRISRGDREEDAPSVFGLAVGLAGFLACVYPDMQLFTQTVAPVFWAFFGLLLALVTRVTITLEEHEHENRHSYIGNSSEHLAGQYDSVAT